jgi:hypothetical protein
MKFSIRDLMWLTAVVAIALGWWVEHRASSIEVDRFRNQNSQIRAEMVKLEARAFRAEMIGKPNPLLKVDPFSSSNSDTSAPVASGVTGAFPAVQSALSGHSHEFVLRDVPAPTPNPKP